MRRADLLGLLLVMACAGIIAFVVISVQTSSAGPTHPTEQTPGHLSSDDLRNGITAVMVTVNGRKVPCVYAAAPGSSGGWAGGVSITCDWNAAT